MQRLDPRYDLLRFGLSKDITETGLGRLRKALVCDWRLTGAALYHRLLGRRLRASMRIRALIGDRIRFHDGIVGATVKKIPPADWPIDWPIKFNAQAATATSAFLLVGPPCCEWPIGAEQSVKSYFAENPAIMAAYTNAIAINAPGIPSLPILPPAFDADHTCAMPPYAPAIAVRRGWFEKLGGLAIDARGAEVADFLLRTAAMAGRNSVGYIDDIFVVWQAQSSESELGATATAAILDARIACARRHLPDTHAADEFELDECGAVRHKRNPPEWPKATVIVPTRDRLDLLKPCIDGLLEKTDYPDLEIIVVDNGSTEPETLAYLDALAKDRRISVLRDEGPFNYSRLNNRAAALSTGEVLILLNNDISMIEGDWLKAMVSEAVRPGVGAVGAKLLYPSGLVQHAGIVMGLSNTAGHAFQFYPRGHRGYLHQLETSRQVAGVTAACLAVEKSKFMAVGGLDEASLQVAFNDVDLCLKLNAAGLANIFNPRAVLFHHESASRASDRAPSQRERWNREKAALQAKWPQWTEGDPWYPSRLGKQMADFSLPKAYVELANE